MPASTARTRSRRLAVLALAGVLAVGPLVTDAGAASGSKTGSRRTTSTTSTTTAQTTPTTTRSSKPAKRTSTTTTTVAPTTTTTAPTTTTTAPTTTTTAPAPTDPDGWQVLWSDEFDGSGPSSSWRMYHNTYGDGNAELACLTPGNVGVSSGTLKIEARRELITCPSGAVRAFSSGFLGTRETGTYFPRYGRFEMRAKLPHGQGLWPAFWLRHRNGAGVAEVDVMEYFHSVAPGVSTGTLHLDGRTNLSKRAIPFETPTTSPGWHTWAVDIEPVAEGVRFTFHLDGTEYHSYTDTQHAWADAADPEATWDIAVNLAVGGRWTGRPDDALGYLSDLDRCAQGGTPPLLCRADGIVRAQFPSTYEVDYVRVLTR